MDLILLEEKGKKAMVKMEAQKKSVKGPCCNFYLGVASFIIEL